MADQMTVAEKTPEDFEREMLQTRESLTQKVNALETQVVGAVQTAADTLTGTVEAVKSLVSEAPEAVSDTMRQAAAVVSESVKETLDITGHVRRHPWVAVGISALFGSVVGCLMAPRRVSFDALASASPPTGLTPPAPVPASRPSDEKPGVIDEIFSLVGEKAKEIARTAMESVSAAIKQQIESNAPTLVDGVATHLAGTSANSSDSPFASRLSGAARSA